MRQQKGDSKNCPPGPRAKEVIEIEFGSSNSSASITDWQALSAHNNTSSNSSCSANNNNNNNDQISASSDSISPANVSRHVRGLKRVIRAPKPPFSPKRPNRALVAAKQNLKPVPKRDLAIYLKEPQNFKFTNEGDTFGSAVRTSAPPAIDEENGKQRNPPLQQHSHLPVHSLETSGSRPPLTHQLPQSTPFSLFQQQQQQQQHTDHTQQKPLQAIQEENIHSGQCQLAKLARLAQFSTLGCPPPFQQLPPPPQQQKSTHATEPLSPPDMMNVSVKNLDDTPGQHWSHHLGEQQLLTLTQQQQQQQEQALRGSHCSAVPTQQPQIQSSQPVVQPCQPLLRKKAQQAKVPPILVRQGDNAQPFPSSVLDTPSPVDRAEPVQCHRCQKFGHSKNNCRRSFVCLKCAGGHPTTVCNKPRNTSGMCANCNGEHIASFKGCPMFKSERAKLLSVRLKYTHSVLKQAISYEVNSQQQRQHQKPKQQQQPKQQHTPTACQPPAQSRQSNSQLSPTGQQHEGNSAQIAPSLVLTKARSPRITPATQAMPPTKQPTKQQPNKQGDHHQQQQSRTFSRRVNQQRQQQQIPLRHQQSTATKARSPWITPATQAKPPTKLQPKKQFDQHQRQQSYTYSRRVNQQQQQQQTPRRQIQRENNHQQQQLCSPLRYAYSQQQQQSPLQLKLRQQQQPPGNAIQELMLIRSAITKLDDKVGKLYSLIKDLFSDTSHQSNKRSPLESATN